jgi:hypothetical protein
MLFRTARITPQTALNKCPLIQHTLNRVHLPCKGLVSGDKWSRVARLEGFAILRKLLLFCLLR